MSKTAREIVQLKLNNLKGKTHLAQQCIIKFDEKAETFSLTLNSVNMILDKVLLSMDEFVSKFEGESLLLSQGQGQGDEEDANDLTRGDCSNIPLTQVANQGTGKTEGMNGFGKLSDAFNFLFRVEKLEEAMDEMRSTIHGGGDGEGSPHRGILSHLSVLENSFNEGKQNLLSMEEKVLDVDIKQASFSDEMKEKCEKDRQRMEMENITREHTREQLQKLDKRLTAITSYSAVCKLELKNMEGHLKGVQSVTDSNRNKLMQLMSKTTSTNEDQKKELDNVSETKQDEKGEERTMATTVSDTDSVKKRLTTIEDQLKSVKEVKEEEIKELKLQVSKLDSLTKTQIVQRLSILENSPTVAFGVCVKHNGPWTNWTVVRSVESVDFNIGNAFQVDQCRFLVPVEGIYGLILYVLVKGSGRCTMNLWSCEAQGGGWRDSVFSLTTQGQEKGKDNSDVTLVHLEKGEAIRLRVEDGASFEKCYIQGWLISPI